MTAEIICVGTELLLGDILNTNAQFLSRELAELGINLKDGTDKLEADGVAAFIKSWDSVLADVQSGIDRVNA